MEWLLFSYWLPPEPSRKRVYIWRQLKKMGALSNEGVWLLPGTDEFVKGFSELVKSVEGMEGTANLYIISHFTEEQEQRTISKFRQEREKEYSEIIAECHKALKHIEWETERQEFNFEEVEELEGDLDKILRWYTEVHNRDFWQTEIQAEVEKRIKEVEYSLAAFTHKTWETTAQPQDEG